MTVADAPFLSDDVGEMEAQRRAAFEQSGFGWVDSKLKGASDWIKGWAQRRQPKTEVGQLPFSSVSPVELIPMMATEGARTVNRWLYGTKDPGMLRPEDTLAPSGAGVMAAPFAAAKHGVSLGTSGGKLAAQALDMSPEARMARAKEMGFDTDTPLYHGAGSPVEGFEPGRNAWFTDNPDLASATAAKLNGRSFDLTDEQAMAGNSVIPAFMRSDNMATLDFNAMTPDPETGLRRTTYDRAIQKAFDDGSEVVRVQNAVDTPLVASNKTFDAMGITDPQGQVARPSNVYVTRNPANIRSPFAAFDPAQAGSANLLAADQVRSSMPAIVTEGMRSAGELNKAPFQPEGIRAYHGSGNGMPAFQPHSDHEVGPHFGTIDQANARLQYTNRMAQDAKGAPSITPVDMRFQNPLEIDDPGMFDVFNLPFALERSGAIDPDSIARLQRHEARALDADENPLVMPEITRDFSGDLRDIMREHGYDALKYRNTAESPEINKIMEDIREAARRQDKDGEAKLWKLKEKTEKRLAAKGAFSYVPMERGTVYSATTGDLLYANPGTEQIMDILRAQQQLQGPFQEE